jgi:hypothetical protein
MGEEYPDLIIRILSELATKPAYMISIKVVAHPDSEPIVYADIRTLLMST